MHLTIILLAVLFVSISGVLGQEQSAQGDLTLVISGFDNDEGVVKIALSDTQEDYEAKDEAFRGEEAIIKNETTDTSELQCTFMPLHSKHHKTSKNTKLINFKIVALEL